MTCSLQLEWDKYKDHVVRISKEMVQQDFVVFYAINCLILCTIMSCVSVTLAMDIEITDTD